MQDRLHENGGRGSQWKPDFWPAPARGLSGV